MIINNSESDTYRFFYSLYSSKTLLCHHFVYPPSHYVNIICEMYLITKIKNIGYRKIEFDWVKQNWPFNFLSGL